MTDWAEMKKNCTGRTKQLQKESDAIVDGMERDENSWIANLRKEGFKAAHPNDGWINRVDKNFILCYPQFDDGVTLGSMVMLGWPFEEKANVPVVITEVRPSKYGNTHYSYVEVTKLTEEHYAKVQT
jgi:hypothetical protein